MDNSIAHNVLQFYKICPFNEVSSKKQAADYLKKTNIIQSEYPDLANVLSSKTVSSVLEGGCGIGWMSTNISLHYDIGDLCAFDFNPEVLKQAEAISQNANVSNIKFETHDILSAETLPGVFDLVISIGVLHHTGDCRGGLAQLCTKLAEHDNSRLYIGLYHKYGRSPYIKHFRQLEKQGKTEEELFEAFVNIYGESEDILYLKSRFRDDIQHPHETWHSLEEVSTWLTELGLEIESTSINNFQPIEDLEELFIEERKFEAISYRANILENRYFPGLFTLCARRC